MNKSDYIDKLFEGTQYEESVLLKTFIRNGLGIDKGALQLITELQGKPKEEKKKLTKDEKEIQKIKDEYNKQKTEEQLILKNMFKCDYDYF